MSFGAIRISYKIRSSEPGSSGTTTVSGLKIGRFAVREVIERGQNLPVQEMDKYAHHAWHVDHINTGARVFSSDSFDEALAVADTVSTYAKRDPASRDPHKAVAQIGEPIKSWMRWMKSGNGYVPFRQWLSDLGYAWHPRSRRWRKAR